MSDIKKRRDETKNKIDKKQTVEHDLDAGDILQLVLNNIPQFIFWKDINSVYLGCNRNFAEVAGVEKPENIVGKSDYDLAWEKSEADFFCECDRRVMDTNIPEYHIVEPQLQADGKKAWLDTNKIPLHNTLGEVIGILGTFEDITERIEIEEKFARHRDHLEELVNERTKELLSANEILQLEIKEHEQTEERLKLSEERSRTWLEHSPVCTKIVDLDFNLQYMSSSGIEVLHIPDIKLFYGKPYPFDFFPESYKKLLTSNLEKTRATGEIIEQEASVVDIDGNELWFHSTIVPVNDDGGRIEYIIIVSLDITESKQAESKRTDLESQLRQTQKMEAIGTMAGGIAHDFNNILAIIGGNLELLQFKKESGMPFEENLEHIREASSRAKNLVAQILAFSRKEHKDLIPVNLSTFVNESTNFLRPMIPATVEVVTEVPRDHVFINADTTQLQQVFINLCTNAIHAMKEKGLLRISLEEGELTSQEVLLAVEPQASRYAKLSVADTGKGMDKKTLDQIFDPFFTTKEVGSGTGMGLSMVHGIIEQHGGFIHVDSSPGQGTTFTLYFPVTSDVETSEGLDAETNLPTGTESILFVDDEQYVADVSGSMLGHLGYKVTIMTNSVEALDLFKAHPDEFDMVITDQTMPKVSGVELAKEIFRIRPKIPVILCSGYSATVSEEAAMEGGIRAFCMKPMEIKQFATVVRDVLDAG